MRSLLTDLWPRPRKILPIMRLGAQKQAVAEGAGMSISAGYIESVRELLAFVPELEIKKMFGGAGATAGGMMFAILADDELWLKGDDQSRLVFLGVGLVLFTYPTKV